MKHTYSPDSSGRTVDIVLAAMSEEMKAELARTPVPDLDIFHFGLGQWIRWMNGSVSGASGSKASRGTRTLL